VAGKSQRWSGFSGPPNPNRYRAHVGVQNPTNVALKLRVETPGLRLSETIRQLGLEAAGALDLTS